MNDESRIGDARLALILALAWGGPAPAQETAAPSHVEKIEITGTNIRRVESETGLPVQVITRDEMERAGVQTAQDLVDRISAHQSAGGYNDAKGIGSPTGSFGAASLRGLGSDKTLVLLNGRRLAPYALSLGTTIDISSIPMGAIERVEVLKDGASAVYGTDAIGGVINFILRKDFRGVDIGGTVLSTQQGGGGSRRATATLGYGDLQRDGFNAFVNIDYIDQSALKASDREVSRTSYIPWLGLDGTSGQSFPANISQRLPSNGGFRVPRNPGVPCLPPLSFPTEQFPEMCRFDYAAIIDILPPSEKTTALLRVSKQVGADHQIFVEASRYHAYFKYRISPTPVASEFAPDLPPFVLPPSSPYYPTDFVRSQPGGDSTQPVRVNYRLVELGPRVEDGRVDEDRAVVGMQGALGPWDYQGGLLYSANREVTSILGGEVSATAFNQLLRSGVVNPFGPNTPAVLDLMRQTEVRGKTSDNRATNRGADFKASRDLMRLAGGPLAIALGMEARRETLDLQNEPILYTGDVLGGNGPQPTLSSASRNIASLYAEANIPLAKALEANLAIRTDRYSDFGTTTNPKLTLRWQAAKNVLVRASAGSGFRAPSLFDIFQPPVIAGLELTSEVPDPLRCAVTHSEDDCGDRVTFGDFGGNRSLKPEHSKQANIGIVLESSIGWSASLDYYWVRLTDRIGPPSTLSFDRVVRGPPDAQHPDLPGPVILFIGTPQNLDSLRSAGVDIDMRYRVAPSALGRFTLSLNGTYVAKYETSGANDTLPASAGRAAVNGGAVSRWRHFLALDWTRGAWGATLAQNFQDGYDEPDRLTCDENGVNCGLRRVGSAETWDAQVRWEGIRNLKVTLGAYNIFNRASPVSSQVGGFQRGYDPGYGDPRGRTYYVTIRYSYR